MINEVKINDYSQLGCTQEDKVIITEFAGRCCIEIVGESKVEVCFEDLLRAWQAVKKG